MSVLIVEDDDHFAEILRYWLGPREIRTARTMAEARKLIEEHAPKAVLLDLALPDSTPSETLERIAEIKKSSPDAMVIVMTGNTRAGERANSAGAAKAFVKDEAGFFEKVDRALVESGIPANSKVLQKIQAEVARIVNPSE